MEDSAVILASVWSEWLWPVLQLVVGLGLVIFVHELGHFLVAKAVGIKVERFALGFGPRLFGLRRGETDYCVNALPLGGYVKMLGQEDFAPLKEGEGDPRAFNNKSVGARLAVISAGVTMNVIFAAVLFVIVGLVGRNVLAPVIGDVEDGFPAARARIAWDDATTTAPASAPSTQTSGRDEDDKPQPGDRVVRIEGDSIALWMKGYRADSFADVMTAAALADPDEKYVFTIERTVDGRKRLGRAEISVRMSAGQASPMFGLAAASSLTLGRLKDLTANTLFEEKDEIVAIDGKAVEHYWRIEPTVKNFTGQPVKVTVLRKGGKQDVQVQPQLVRAKDVVYLKDGGTIRGRVEDFAFEGEGKDRQTVYTFRLRDGETRTIREKEISGDSLNILGMVPRLRVVSVSEKSPAEKAGIKPGDIVVGYGDRGAPTLDEFLEINEEVAGEGTHVNVLRGGEQKSLRVVPKKRKNGAQVGLSQGVDLMHTVVAAVRSGSPANKAGIRPGATITKINGVKVSTWIDVYQTLVAGAGREVSISWKFGEHEKTAALGVLDEEKFSPKDYRLALPFDGMGFEPLMVRIKQPGVFSALTWGCREAVRMTILSYAGIRSLVKGSISTEKGLSGPLGIGKFALEAGRGELMQFVFFMAFISIALAVFNFLPFPVVDGGHAVFLIIEKVRGKPVPVKVMNVVQVIGIVLILALVVFVTWNDIRRIWGDSW